MSPVGFEIRRGLHVGAGQPLLVMSGPCVIESAELCVQVGRKLKSICDDLGLGYVFKASFDKANRTDLRSFRGPGLERGLAILKDVRQELDVPVVTDVHECNQVDAVAEIAEIVQIPALLCRQTDLLLAAGGSGRTVNIKKGQFLSPEALGPVVEKVLSTGNQRVLLTERGTTFGYDKLVVDMRSPTIMRGFGLPVIFDATHAVQQPGGLGFASDGNRELAPVLTRAAAGTGAIDGLFLETHPDPDHALSDGPNSIALDDMPATLRDAKAIHELVRAGHPD